MLVVDTGPFNDVNPIDVGACRDQPRSDGIARCVFGTEPDHVTLRCVALPCVEAGLVCDGGADKCSDVSFPHIGQAGNQANLALSETVRPKPINAAYVRTLVKLELVDL